MKKLAEQIRRVGTNINQLAHAYNAGLLIQPVNAGSLFTKLQEVLTKSLELIYKICYDSATYNGHFLKHFRNQINKIKPAK